MLTLEQIGGGKPGLFTAPKYYAKYDNGDWTVAVQRTTDDPFAVILDCIDMALTRDERNGEMWRGRRDA